MTSIKAYYDGHEYVTEGNVAVRQNQKVIITLLDDYVPVRTKKTLEEIRSYMNSCSKSVPEGISSVDYIRHMRED